MSLPEYVTINGTRHASANLSDAAKNQIVHIQIADAEIIRLQQLLALAQTARNAYTSILMLELRSKEEVAVEDKPKKARAARKGKTSDAA